MRPVRAPREEAERWGWDAEEVTDEGVSGGAPVVASILVAVAEWECEMIGRGIREGAGAEPEPVTFGFVD